MTLYEHAMLGSTLALAAGLRRRYGWPIVALAGVSAVVPDWDAVSFVFGGAAYDRAHRIWGHNVLVAAALGALVGVAEYRVNLYDRGRRLVRVPDPSAPTSPMDGPRRAPRSWLVWTLTAALASLSHLPADLIYSGRPGMENWPLELLWPFSTRTWAFPIVPWGDVGATLVFIAEMFALYRWPARSELTARLTLGVLVAYIGTRYVAAVGS